MHLVVFTAIGDVKVVHVVNNTILDLCCIYSYMIYSHNATNDMSDLKLYGAWKVGFKRSRSQHGN